MLKSRVKAVNGTPCLFVEGERVAPVAYTTYFEERSRFTDFIESGHRIFFVNLAFTRLPINTWTCFTPFRVGAFENIENPDYSEFENAVHKIIAACPDAIIFPRIYVSMPKVWCDAHPDDTIEVKRGHRRESLLSQAFRRDGGALLERTLEHIKNTDYSSRIGGWFLCGGLTQEWMYFDYDGGICQSAAEPYRAWVKERYGEDGATLPSRSDYVRDGDRPMDENAQRYSIFCSEQMARTVDFFAEIIKKKTDFSQVVGAFYGYSHEILSPICGSYGLHTIVGSANLDFFSSPCAYTLSRRFGIDWADMLPVDSIRHHGKLAFIECDIRTYLTCAVQLARPGEYPDDIYMTNGVSLWAGPPTAELSVFALRKAFAHQMTRGSAIWWFDMWGGWYDDPKIMEALVKMRELAEAEPREFLEAQVALLADENGFGKMASDSPRDPHFRTAAGNAGAPFDSLLVEDAEAVIGKYKAVIFNTCYLSDAGREAVRLCEKMGIPYLLPTCEGEEITPSQIREFYRGCGVHIYNDGNDVVYVGNGYIALHSDKGGKKRLNLPEPCRVEALYGAETCVESTDVVEFELKENDTALFAVFPK